MNWIAGSWRGSLSLSPLLSFGGLWGEVSPTQCAFPTPAGSGSGNLELSSRWGFGPVDRRRTVLGGVIMFHPLPIGPSPTGPWGGNPRESCGGEALLGGRVDSKAGPLFYPARCVQGLPRTSSLWRKQSEGGEPYCQQHAAYMSGLRPPTRPPPPIPKERRRDHHNCRTEAPRESPLPTDPTPRQGVSVSRSQGSPGEPCCPGAPLRTSFVHLRASPAQDWGLKSPRCPFSPLLAGHHFGPHFKQNKTKC